VTIKKKLTAASALGALLVTVQLSAGTERVPKKPTFEQLKKVHQLIVHANTFIKQYNEKVVPKYPYSTHTGSKIPGDWLNTVKNPINAEEGSISIPLLAHSIEADQVFEGLKQMLREEIQPIIDKNKLGLKISEIKFKNLDYNLYFDKRLFPGEESPLHSKGAIEAKIKFERQKSLKKAPYKPRSKI
jgi:hypothetical protein